VGRILMRDRGFLARFHVAGGLELHSWEFDKFAEILAAYVRGQAPDDIARLIPVFRPIGGEGLAKPDGPTAQYRFALRFAQEHGPHLRAGDRLRAFQVLTNGRRSSVRINEGIRGRLEASFTLGKQDKVRFEHRLVLHDDEPSDASHWTVIQAPGTSPVQALVMWDAVPTFLRKASDPKISRMIEDLLAVPGARQRWRSLVQQAPGAVRSALYASREESPERIAFKTLEALEKDVRAGLPSRKTKVTLESLDPETLDSIAGEGPDNPVTALDPSRFLESLADKDQEILRMSYLEDLTEEQIGRRLGITQQAVSKRLKKALQQLRRNLAS